MAGQIQQAILADGDDGERQVGLPRDTDSPANEAGEYPGDHRDEQAAFPEMPAHLMKMCNGLLQHHKVRCGIQGQCIHLGVQPVHFHGKVVIGCVERFLG